MNKKNYLPFLQKIKDLKIAVVGDFMLDEYIWGEVERISPEAPVPILQFGHSTVGLGGAGNVSNNIISMGAKVYNIGITGNDEFRDVLLKMLSSSNSDTTALFVSEDSRPTIRKTRLFSNNHQLLRIDYENSNTIGSKNLSDIKNSIAKIIDEIDAIIVSDYGKGLISQELMKFIVEQATKKGVFVSVDPKKRNFSNYSGADIITPNQKEAESMLDKKFSTFSEILESGNEIIESFGVKKVLITLGPHGMALFEKDKKPFAIPTFAQQVYDVTGAGDTVIAMFTMAISAGASPVESAEMSNIAAGIVVGKIGCVPINFADMEEKIKKD